MPEYFQRYETAKILGIKVWELDDVPLLIQAQAWTIHQAKKEALAQIVKDSKGGIMTVNVIDL